MRIKRRYEIKKEDRDSLSTCAYFKKPSEKTSPVANSTKGYWREILDLQFEHFPFKKRKLTRGIFSYQAIFLPHEKHPDRPDTKLRPVLKRKITTLRKLPTIAPKENKKTITKKSWFIIYTSIQNKLTC